MKIYKKMFVYNFNDFIKYNFLLIFFCTTISISKTSILHSNVVNILRISFLGFFVINALFAGILFVKRNKIKIKTFYLLLFNILFVLFGFLGAVINGGIEYFEVSKMLWLDLIIILTMALSLSFIYELEDSDHKSIDKYLIAYFLMALILILVCNGVIFHGFPRFNYEYSNFSSGVTSYYSQGISKIFGMASILLFCFLVKKRRCKSCIIKNFKNLFLLILSICFLLLSALGGGRGDFLIASLCIIFILLINKPVKFLISILLLTFSGIYLVDKYSPFYSLENVVGNFTLIGRLSVFLSGNLGERDVLLLQSIDLIKNEPLSLLFGKGFNFFQHYYGYNYGLYPHNFFAEFIICFGLPLAIIVFGFSCRGALLSLKKYKLDRMYIILFIYTILVSLKSGSLLDYHTIVFISFFFIEGVFEKFKLKKTKLNTSI